MNTSDDPERDAEAARVGRIYERYRASRWRQRAWAADNPGNVAIRKELLEALLEEAGPELRSGGQVLDVGCGTGYWLAALHESGVDPERLFGVDVLPERVAASAERVPGATVRQADARALPFEEGRFGVVLMFTVLGSLSGTADVWRALSGARRVLRDRGVLVVYEPALPNPLNIESHWIRDSDFERAGIQPRHVKRVTLLPPLARSLGASTARLYPQLTRLSLLRTHRVVAFRKPRPAASGSCSSR